MIFMSRFIVITSFHKINTKLVQAIRDEIVQNCIKHAPNLVDRYFIVHFLISGRVTSEK